MKPWVVWLAGVGLIAVCFSAGRVLSTDTDAVPLDGTLTLTAGQKAEIYRRRPEHPANQPFPGPDSSLSKEQKQAVEAVSKLAHAGAQTRVVSVEMTTYNGAMCGRMANYYRSDRPVWLVWFEGPFQEHFVFSIPQPGPDGKALEMPPEPPSKAYVVDASDFVSQQSFAPWPLPRDPKAYCVE